MSAVATRLRKLEAKRPSGVCALSDEELDARIDRCMAALLAEYGSVDALAASCRAAGNEPAARLVEGYRERTIWKAPSEARGETACRVSGRVPL